MPRYTYVATYRGMSYIAQRRRSNFQGFGDWIEELPPMLRKKATKKMFAGFEPVPNRQNVWRKTLMIDDGELVVIAVQTDS
jgi:hypothetical protein